ncbi:hypothetical protein XENOCAPTIV_003514, partial [Xenoophorus captivus]
SREEHFASTSHQLQVSFKEQADVPTTHPVGELKVKELQVCGVDGLKMIYVKTFYKEQLTPFVKIQVSIP